MSFKVLISQINEVIILQMEAMHETGYSTLSIRTWHYIYSVKLLNVWGGKTRIGTKKKKKKKKNSS